MAAKKGETRPWASVGDRLPRKHGWYAVQDATVHGDWYMDAYWDGSGWWTFGKHVSLHVKKEVLGVLRWRHMNDKERETILAEAPDASVPKGPQASTPFLRRMYLLHTINTNKLDKLQLVSKLGWPRKSVEMMLMTLHKSVGASVERRADRTLYVKDWGPINNDWIKKNLKSIEETLNAASAE